MVILHCLQELLCVLLNGDNLVAAEYEARQKIFFEIGSRMNVNTSDLKNKNVTERIKEKYSMHKQSRPILNKNKVKELLQEPINQALMPVAKKEPIDAQSIDKKVRIVSNAKTNTPDSAQIKVRTRHARKQGQFQSAIEKK